jgi:signal transduction histidine kinase
MTGSPDELEAERLAEVARLALLGRMADAVAHDVATPLASIALRAESLLRKAKAAGLDGALAEQFERHLGSIHQDTFRMSRMLDALRGSRGPAGALAIQELLDAAAASASHAAAAKGLAIEVLMEAPPSLVRGSAGRLRLALGALLRNAIEASEAGGRVTLGARRAGEALELRVDDDGPGLPPAIEARLFSAFNSSRPLDQGLGLGLFLCHRIALEHEGRLELVRLAPRGTSARLTLAERGAA